MLGDQSVGKTTAAVFRQGFRRSVNDADVPGKKIVKTFFPLGGFGRFRR